MSKSAAKPKKTPAAKTRKNSEPSSGSKAETGLALRASEAVEQGRPGPATAKEAGCRVKFECRQPNAQSVCLAASFNNWDPASTLMARGADGCWNVEVNLAPGTYEYQFVVDGVWTEDPKAQRQTPNPFGTLNSVVEIQDEQRAR